MLYPARWKKITVDQSKVLKNRLYRLFCFFWATRYIWNGCEQNKRKKIAHCIPEFDLLCSNNAMEVPNSGKFYQSKPRKCMNCGEILNKSKHATKSLSPSVANILWYSLLFLKLNNGFKVVIFFFHFLLRFQVAAPAGVPKQTDDAHSIWTQGQFPACSRYCCCHIKVRFLITQTYTTYTWFTVFNWTADLDILLRRWNLMNYLFLHMIKNRIWRNIFLTLPFCVCVCHKRLQIIDSQMIPLLRNFLKN